jgi:AraC-like DNA-binding protein
MLKGIIYCKVPSLRTELEKVLGNITAIDIHFITNPQTLMHQLKKQSILFLLLTAETENDIKSILQQYKKHPQSFLIFYHKALNVQNITQSDLCYFSYIIIGDGREKNLHCLIETLSETYWKKIPFQRIGITYHKLSNRIKKVMHYIETHDLKECNSAKIANHLNISQGYFSQEFKRETSVNYREFMQNLLAYYENILFEQMDMPAKSASQLLGYSELSSFSRSFKKRKGYPPSHKRKHAI